MAELHAPGWVAAAIRQGLSASAGLREFRANGGKIRDTVWRKIYAEQKVTVDRVGDEITKPLGAVPDQSEMTVMTTKRKEGYLQTLDIFVRLVGTDTVITRPFMFSGSTLMSRGEALTKALTQMQQAVDEERYEEVVLGGVYTGTRIMQVGEVE